MSVLPDAPASDPPPSVRGLTVEARVGTDGLHTVWRARAEDGSLRALEAPIGRGGLRAALDLRRRAMVARRVRDPGVLAPLRVAGLRRPVAVLPWAAGGSLAELLATQGPPGPERACALGDQMAGGLRALHRSGWSHGDLHPGHVLLLGSGHPVLTGFRRARRRRRRTSGPDQDLVALCRLVRKLAAGPSDALPPELAEALRDPIDLATLASRLRSMVPAPEGAVLPGRSDQPGDRPVPAPARPPGRLRRVTMVGAVAVAVGLAVGAGHQVARGGGCPTPPDPAADVDGDGCEEPLRWSSDRAVLSVDRDGGPAWRLGRPGDQLLLRDWDCDGTVTPGLARPSTGQVFTFDHWPDDGVARPTVHDGEPSACP